MRILVDGHVHVYDDFQLSSLLYYAFRNFLVYSRRLGWESTFVGILMLAETTTQNWFHSLWESLQGGGSHFTRLNPWELHADATTLPCVIVRRKGILKLIIIPGRQVVTNEGLEVLALATNETFKDGNTLTEVVKLVCAADGVSVLPWGVGKWLGKRGRVIESYLRSASGTAEESVLLGDNGGRPKFWPYPKLLTLGARWGFKTLPGTDPLPFPEEQQRIGSFGVAIDSPLREEDPITHVKSLLRDPQIALWPYGQPEDNLQFVRNQLRLRLINKKLCL